jgi:hypothetical protein
MIIWLAEFGFHAAIRQMRLKKFAMGAIKTRFLLTLLSIFIKNPSQKRV